MNDKQRQFILLRADGLSYDKIAKKLRASKAALIQWSKLFESEIKEIQFQSFLEIKESYAWSKRAKYEMLLKQLQKIDEGILQADLSSANIKDLVTIKNNITVQLEAIEKSISTTANITQTDDFGNKETIMMKLYEAE